MPWTRNEASPSLAASSSNTRMNSAPIALRLASGSLSPASRARKRSSASTATSGTLKWSRKAEMTCSPSFLRIRPWSTNTHVSWSPIARCTSSAATDESTPPESPQMTLPRPDLGADRGDLLLDDRRGAPAALAAADVLQERRQDLLPVGRVDDLGVELDAVDPPLDVLERRDGRLGRRRQRRVARRRLVHRVAVRHPARLLRRRAGQQPAGLADGQPRAAELADLGALDAPAERQHDRLHAVADAQHRDPELEQLRVQPRRARRVHGRRAAREDQALRPALAHLVDAHVVRQQLGEHPELAHPPGDQLRVLAAVVEHDDLVRGELPLERELLDRLVGDRRAADLHVPTPSPPAPSPRRGRPCPRPGRAAAACPRSGAPARSSARRG